MHAVHRMPGRALQALVDAVPARHQFDVDRLHALARHQAQRGVARCRHQVEAAFVHQRNHLVGGVGGLDINHAAGLFFETGHPVEIRIGFAAFDVSGPGHDIDAPLALAYLLQHIRCLNLSHAKGQHGRDGGGHQFLFQHLSSPGYIFYRWAGISSRQLVD